MAARKKRPEGKASSTGNGKPATRTSGEAAWRSHAFRTPAETEKGARERRGRAERLATLLFVAELLYKTDKGLTRAELQGYLKRESLPASPNTVRRLIKDLRTLGFPVETRNVNGELRYLIPEEAMTPFRRGMAAMPVGAQREALGVALHLLRNLEGTGLHRALKRFADRLRIVVTEAVPKVAFRDPDEPPAGEVLVLQPATTAADPRVTEAVDRAVRERRRLRIRYRGARDEAARWREVDPAALHLSQRALYLHAWCLEADEARTFKLSRIVEAEVLPDPAEHAGRVDVAGRVRRAAVAWDGEPVEVAVRLSPRVARFAREYPLHAEQRLEPQPDGSVVVRATVAGLVEPMRWTVGWGREARALAPERLVEMVREELHGALAGYGAATPDPTGQATPVPPSPQ